MPGTASFACTDHHCNIHCLNLCFVVSVSRTQFCTLQATLCTRHGISTCPQCAFSLRPDSDNQDSAIKDKHDSPEQKKGVVTDPDIAPPKTDSPKQQTPSSKKTNELVSVATLHMSADRNCCPTWLWLVSSVPKLIGAPRDMHDIPCTKAVHADNGQWQIDSSRPPGQLTAVHIQQRYAQKVTVTETPYSVLYCELLDFQIAPACSGSLQPSVNGSICRSQYKAACIDPV